MVNLIPVRTLLSLKAITLFHMKKFYLAFIIAFLICQDSLAQVAGNPDISWYDNTKNSFVLSTAEQFLGLSKLTNEGNSFEGKKIYLSSNISLEGVLWTPIGTPENPFKGNFDGCLHNVSLYDVTDSEYGGFFGYVMNASIKNVSVACRKEINNCQNFGAITAASDAQTVISHCTHIEPLTVNGAFTVGGISASSDSYITGCTNNGAVISNKNMQSFVGGLVGKGSPIIDNSVNNALVNGSVIVGGIIGKLSSADTKVTMTNCINRGDIAIKSNTENHAYSYSIGGIVGVAPYIYMVSCWNEGKVSVSSYKDDISSSTVDVYAAGLIGEGAGNIKYCYNVGEVFVRNIQNSDSKSAKINNAVAGLIGMNTEKGITEVSYSYNAGNVLTFGQAPIKVTHNYGAIVGNIKTFMPKFVGVYSLEDCCKVLDSNGSTVSSTFNNSEIQVTKEQMSSPDFLVPVKSTITLNNELVYLLDRGNKNNGLPVLKSVITSTPTINEDESCVLHGITKLSGKKYFKYWITGMENYSVDVSADDDFMYNIGKLAEGEHNVKAYVVLPDNSEVGGEKVSFIVKKTASQFDELSGFDLNVKSVNANSENKSKSSTRNRKSSRRNRR